MAQFLDDYLKFTAEFTETNSIVHAWSFITAIGALVGRKKYLPFGAKNIYPNMYVMIV